LITAVHRAVNQVSPSTSSPDQSSSNTYWKNTRQNGISTRLAKLVYTWINTHSISPLKKELSKK